MNIVLIVYLVDVIANLVITAALIGVFLIFVWLFAAGIAVSDYPKQEAPGWKWVYIGFALLVLSVFFPGGQTA